MMRVRTGGQYTLVVGDADLIVEILRHDKPWARIQQGFGAIASLMAELDAARVVLAAVREVGPLRLSRLPGLYAALAQHDRLVDDRELPTRWTLRKC